VREIIVERDRACGVVLADGSSLRARTVIANVNPKFLFEHLVPREAVPTRVAARMRDWKAGSGTFRMNVALSALPNFTAMLGVVGDHHTAGIILGPSLAYMDRAYRDAVDYGWSQSPVIEMLIRPRSTTALRPGVPMWRACSVSTSRRTARRLVGLLPRPGRRSDDRHGRKIRAGFRSSIVGRHRRSTSSAFGLPNGDIRCAHARPIVLGPPMLSRRYRTAVRPIFAAQARIRRRRDRRAGPQRGACRDPRSARTVCH
jgi:phytoene dehydrogenase-like protein